jgi:hypothetical protein
VLPVTPLAARLFAIWTSVSCLLCLFAGLFVEQSAIFLACYLSFFIVGLFFGLEYAKYKTYPIGRYQRVTIFIVVFSISLMTYHMLTVPFKI